MKRLLLLGTITIAAITSSCNSRLKNKYVWTPSSQSTPPAPDYFNNGHWAALPSKQDLADNVPSASFGFNNQENAPIDVFFIHPTSYLQQTDMSTGWNANINDEAINRQTDQGSIKYQASVFNQAGKIYAPRYRQACIRAYFTADTLNKQRALEIAYQDVKSAFDYYMTHWNHGRPVIIASHSQGTTHAIRLLQDYFDHDDAVAEKLVAAYLVGMPVWDTLFVHLRPCGDADDTRCYTTWRTYAKGYFPKNYVKPEREAVCTNPLTWKTDDIYAPRSSNNGSILKNFNKVYSNVCDAQVLDGVVRISRPRFPGSFLYRLKNYHIVDYNLFYLSIRENSLLRTRMFQDVQPNK
ncbi:MAG: DUF3089 domain-containing protein [Bacteroidota bacterium]